MVLFETENRRVNLLCYMDLSFQNNLPNRILLFTGSLQFFKISVTFVPCNLYGPFTKQLSSDVLTYLLFSLAFFISFSSVDCYFRMTPSVLSPAALSPLLLPELSSSPSVFATSLMLPKPSHFSTLAPALRRS